MAYMLNLFPFVISLVGSGYALAKSEQKMSLWIYLVVPLIMSLFIAVNSRWLVLSLLSFFEELKKST